MNTILIALDERGLPTEISSEPKKRTQPEGVVGSLTRVAVNGEWVRFGIVEELRQCEPVAAPPPRGMRGDELKWWTYINRPRVQLEPTGALILQIKHENPGGRVSWRDGRRKLEVYLNAFVHQLFAAADAIKQKGETARQWLEMTDAADAEKRARREKIAREARELSQVREYLSRWREVQDLKRFVDDLRMAPVGSANILRLAEDHLGRLTTLATS